MVHLRPKGVVVTMDAVNSRRPGGTLYVLDNFGTPNAHGDNVVAAARQAGFSGPVDQVQIHGRQEDGGKILDAQARMNDPGATPQQFLESLDSYAVNKQVAFYHATADGMREISNNGAHDGALNISRNQSKAELTRGTWNFLTKTDEQGQLENGQALSHAVDAFGIDRDRLFSEDPKVAGPETRLLQQRLADRIGGAINSSPDVKTARREYRQAAADLRRNNVSVVVSSGNEGQIKPQLLDSAFQGQAPKNAQLLTGRSFYDNPLSGPGVTTVGAADFTNGRPEVMGISSPSQNVSVFADGHVQAGSGEREHGTSFSAPVVAAALAKQHGLASVNPQQARDMIMQSQAQQEPGLPAPVLDPGNLRGFLDSEKF